MGKPKVETQEVPDPNEIIETSARVNRVNTVSPFGSTTFVPNSASGVSPGGPAAKGGSPLGGSRSGSAPEFTQVTEFSPEMQAIFGGAIGEALTGAGGAPFEARALPAPVVDIAGMDPSRFEDSVFERQMRLLEPGFGAREEALRQNLADRGIPEGAEQYSFLVDQELDQQNRARSDAALSAVLAGRDFFERDRAFNNQQNQQDFSNRLTLDEGDRAFYLNRNAQGLNQDQIEFARLAQLLGLTPQAPITPVDTTGAFNLSNNVAMNNMNAQNMANQGAFGIGDLFGLGGTLGSAAILASDDTLKANPVKIGETSKGLNVYEFEWKDGRDAPNVGVMAREVEKVMPEAVHDINGTLHVDYSMVGEL